MRTSLFVTLVAGLSALQALSASAQTRFPVNRDTGIQAHESEQFSNEGAVAAFRFFKPNQEAAIIDFDTAAMGTFIASNPGPLKWTLNITLADAAPAGISDVPLYSVESTNDWEEGDGASANYGWTAGTAAATYFFAQSRYLSDPVTKADVANSLHWNDPDSGVYKFTTRTADPITYGIPGGNPVSNPAANPTPEFLNTQLFSIAGLAAGSVVSVEVDPAIIDAMVSDVNNRGFRFGLGHVGVTGSNTRMYSREDGQGRGAYLEVTVVPEPTSLMLLLGSVCCLALRRR